MAGDSHDDHGGHDATESHGAIGGHVEENAMTASMPSIASSLPSSSIIAPPSDASATAASGSASSSLSLPLPTPSSTSAISLGSSEGSSGHSHGASAGSHGASAGGHGMQMTFTTHTIGTPVLFSTLTPNSAPAVLGVFALVFFVAMLFRALVFLRTYMEMVYWSPSTAGVGFNDLEGKKKGLRGISQSWNWKRDIGRMLIAAVTVTLGYVLMLIVMTFVVAWFAAVVLGLAVGELVFARFTAGRTMGAH